ncbi:hypothetical protein IQ247_06280 [Plectonema cf. radiosum LEGE 06105]|uniref:Uncharacterized protein n=1 Tax=Plectonema cf. radiosum LEGE 06105 TaxID=945769 RepID=A0A8J7F9X9_9CYAN|nr:hypothetical protein [Plectonema radiosum]MBE9212318.1 hypothetical protein [Plectonema cf. radiosum LEGE 06105]
MLRSYTSWLIPGIFALVGFGSSMESAKAQTTYPFEATYNVSSSSEPVTQDVSATTISGVSTDAPYGLTKVSGLTYSQIDLATGNFRFNTNPANFGLDNLPSGSVTLFGDGNNKLFGTNNAIGTIDFTNLTGIAENTFTITGGEGLFENATGTVILQEAYQISLDPNVPTIANSKANGTIEVPLTRKVPESNNAVALTGIGIIGAILLRRRCKTAVDLTSFT